ncbi:MAG: hypothetical protein KGN01_07955 [Patescibacteria group bacterium]|nr:hypothetical protein [Patescibacteria group bacterium]
MPILSYNPIGQIVILDRLDKTRRYETRVCTLAVKDHSYAGLIPARLMMIAVPYDKVDGMINTLALDANTKSIEM